jgi:type I restriction enzyme, R subunit
MPSKTTDSTAKVLGDDTLKKIALEWLDTVRKNTTIYWTVKESARAKLRASVKRVPRKYVSQRFVLVEENEIWN